MYRSLVQLSKINEASSPLRKTNTIQHFTNCMVTAYLELAELQAPNRKPMYMKDRIERLDDPVTTIFLAWLMHIDDVFCGKMF